MSTPIEIDLTIEEVDLTVEEETRREPTLASDKVLSFDEDGNLIELKWLKNVEGVGVRARRRWKITPKRTDERRNWRVKITPKRRR